MNLSHYGHRTSIDRIEHLIQLQGIGSVLCLGLSGLLAHPVEVATGAKGFAFASNHNGAITFGDTGECRSQRLDKRSVERVSNLGTVEPQVQNAAFPLFDEHGQVWLRYPSGGMSQ